MVLALISVPKRDPSTIFADVKVVRAVTRLFINVEDILLFSIVPSAILEPVMVLALISVPKIVPSAILDDVIVLALISVPKIVPFVILLLVIYDDVLLR